MKKHKYIVGVDEAGRGPLAGPVAVGIACVPYDFNWRVLPHVGDSKKVSPRNREVVFKQALTLKKQGKLDFAVILINASVIDKKGITYAVKNGISRAFMKLKLNPKKVEVRLDGLLKAPEEYVNQQTIIKGDLKEKVIGLASIMAKVTRDRMMVRLARTYPEYSFEAHKGYGTKVHRSLIKTHGLSLIHRRSYTKRVLAEG